MCVVLQLKFYIIIVPFFLRRIYQQEYEKWKNAGL